MIQRQHRHRSALSGVTRASAGSQRVEHRLHLCNGKSCSQYAVGGRHPAVGTCLHVYPIISNSAQAFAQDLCASVRDGRPSLQPCCSRSTWSQAWSRAMRLQCIGSAPQLERSSRLVIGSVGVVACSVNVEELLDGGDGRGEQAVALARLWPHVGVAVRA